jgi:hypothetical protein
MRLLRTALVTVAAVLAIDVQSGSAQESFYNQRFCTRGIEGKSLNCSYNTWQQCRESTPGLGLYCLENPFWHGPREQPTTEGKGSRRHR